MCSQAYFMFNDVKQPQIYKVLAISLVCSAISVGNGHTDVANVKFNFQLYNYSYYFMMYISVLVA